jgi:DNA polymerase (family 10)
MLDQLAALAAIRGDPADTALFRDASLLVRSRQIQSDADLGPLLDSPPPEADPELLRRLRYMYEAGGWVLLESAIADLPMDLRWLFESGSVTIEQLATLHQSLGITCSADLLAAVRRQEIRSLRGFDAALEAAIAGVLPTLRAALPRIPLGRAVALADPVLERLRGTDGVRWAEPAGSLRRGQDMVGDIEIVAATDDPGPPLAALAALPDVTRVLHRGPTRVYLLTDRVQVGVRCAGLGAAGAVLLQMTGSHAHLSALAALAAERQWTLDSDGLHATPDGSPMGASEDEIYAALDLPCVPPEIRNGTDEIVAARRGTLPCLVSRRDIRGDLHMHTHWSDGRDSPADMIRACAALGYEYVAITDHSPHSGASRTLTPDAVKKQAEEIESLREHYPQIAILHGCEVDILVDGRLDFSDRILSSFDIVLASLHHPAGQGPSELLQRYRAAMEHPLVSVITHPTNRLLPFRAGYDLDYDRLFAAAVETGTAVEIDGAPAHLDLDGALARRAIAAGATVVIDSDCHRSEMLERQMQLGITTARRGWVEPRHVWNTRPIGAIRAAIAAKRGR